MGSSDDTDRRGSPSGNTAERADRTNRMAVLVSVVFCWTWLFNALIKGQSVPEAFFGVVDTLSEDLVMGSLTTVLVGLGIVVVFTATKLYTQIISNAGSFRTLEILVEDELALGRDNKLVHRLLHFHDEPEPPEVYPVRATSMLVGVGLLYGLSLVYLVLFSEALFFVSWSAGVDLPINAQNLQLLPTLALSIPFSARVMAYFRYPYVQDYADFMPGAVFVLLLVASLGFLFESHDQKFFLLQVFGEPALASAFLRNGVLLAFIPVASEICFWILNFIDVKEEADGC